jgi:hypothetical protein
MNYSENHHDSYFYYQLFLRGNDIFDTASKFKVIKITSVSFPDKSCICGRSHDVIFEYLFDDKETLFICKICFQKLVNLRNSPLGNPPEKKNEGEISAVEFPESLKTEIDNLIASCNEKPKVVSLKRHREEEKIESSSNKKVSVHPKYKTRLCREKFVDGVCTRRFCNFAHSINEIMPMRCYNWKYCKDRYCRSYHTKDCPMSSTEFSSSLERILYAFKVDILVQNMK